MRATKQLNDEYHRECWRIRFAWYPVRVWQKGPGGMKFVQGRSWLRRVTEVWTPLRRWRAYIEHQGAVGESKWVKDDA